MSKPRVAFYWCASCGGCEEAVVDLGPALLDVAAAVDVVFWPVALDAKVSDVEALAPGELAVAFVNGAIRTSEQQRMAELLREKAQLLVAFGSCSHMGGIPGLANLVSKEAIFAAAYRDAPTVVNPDRVVPLERSELGGRTLRLPAVFDTVKTLDQVVEVDYYLPGCAPPPDLVQQALQAVLDDALPPRGAVLAPDKALCDTCPRNATKPTELSLQKVVRVHETVVEPDQCFLAAGVLCLGIGTRSGCGERCIEANMPCTGCFGPTDRTADHGGKLLSAVASLFASNEEGAITELAQAVPDPAGTFYRYGLPWSLLRKGV